VNSLPIWSVAAAGVLSQVLAFLMAIVLEVLFGLVKDTGVPALLALVAAGVIGRFLRRVR
jgi:hypothetical protein